MKRKKLYLAGGWFTPEMEEEHTRIYNMLNEHFDVFNPRLASLITDDSTSEQQTQTFIGNIEAIKNSDIVVVITDRKDIGTIWEAGYAYANNKHIVYYAETLGDKPFNLMLAKTGLVSKSEQELFENLIVMESVDIDTDDYQIYDYKGDIE